MPFEPKKDKKQPRTGPLDHRQEVSLSSVDRAFTDLNRILTAVSGDDPEMRVIVNNMRGSLAAAMKWIVEN